MPIERIKCTWNDFREQLRARDGSPRDPIYRGQAKPEWPLVPPSKRLNWDSYLQLRKIAAKNPSLGPAPNFDSANYAGQLKYFRHLATGLPGADISELSEGDLEAIARHNGLCSNLLDWSHSPYVAAFFACTSALDIANDGRLASGQLERSPIFSPTHQIAIWRLACGNDLWVDGEFEAVTTLSPLNFWQKAQTGLFTRLSYQKSADVGQYLGDRNEDGRLTVFLLPGGEALRMLADLKDMNINFATLFPDLRGAAAQANFESVVRLW
jgi:FRG domain